MIESETFRSLLCDRAHWEFELFLMLLFDGIVGCILYPFALKHWKHHVMHDRHDSEKEWAAADGMRLCRVQWDELAKDITPGGMRTPRGGEVAEPLPPVKHSDGWCDICQAPHDAYTNPMLGICDYCGCDHWR